jgi:hypothetical protein
MMDEMPDEVDFSGGIRGKFYPRPRVHMQTSATVAWICVWCWTAIPAQFGHGHVWDLR